MEEFRAALDEIHASVRWLVVELACLPPMRMYRPEGRAVTKGATRGTASHPIEETLMEGEAGLNLRGWRSPQRPSAEGVQLPLL